MSLSDFAPPRYIPAPQYCIGRDAEIEQLVSKLTERPNSQVSVFGGPGIGKGTLGLAVLNSERVKSVFLDSVFYVRCDDLQSYHAFLRTLGIELEVSCADTVSSLASAIVHSVRSDRTLIFFDNAEVPLSCEDAAQVEQFLQSLSRVDSLTLFIAVRSQNPPIPGHRWDLALPVNKLDHEASKNVFLAYAGEQFEGDPLLSDLVSLVGGVPLAIRLIALATRHGIELKRVICLWEKEGSGLLVHKGGEAREDSLETALTVSLKHDWISSVHRSALAAVAFFPKGVGRGLLEKERYIGFRDAVVILLDLGLLERRKEQLSLLLPIQDYVKRHYKLSVGISDSLAISCWQWMEDRCKMIGSPRGSAVIGELAFFASNFEAAIHHGLSSTYWKSACAAVSRYASAGKLGNFGNPKVCDLAVQRVTQEMLRDPNQRDELRLLKARMLRASGFQYEKAAIWQTADERYAEALTALEGLTFFRAKTLRARLTKDIADVALSNLNFDRSKEFYERGKELFFDVEDYREAIECSIGTIETEVNRNDWSTTNQLQEIDEILAEIKRQENTRNSEPPRFKRRNFTRTEAKAFLVKSRIVDAQSDTDLAVNCAIRALGLLSATADVAGTVKVAETLVRLVLSSDNYDRSIRYVSSKLAGNYRYKSHRARARALSFLFFRAGRQSDSESESSVCLKLAQHLKFAGKLVDGQAGN